MLDRVPWISILYVIQVVFVIPRNTNRALSSQITWQTPVGQANEPLIATTVQDTDPSFKYIPEDQWTPGPVNAGTYSGGSGQYVSRIRTICAEAYTYLCSVTSTAGASVEFTFKVSIGSLSSLLSLLTACIGQASIR
jgi:hypothetical protein